MYCINCGVKLADTEKICPLCGVTVFHPEISPPEGEPLYPRGRYPAAQVNSRIAVIILSTLFALPLFICLLCDLNINGTVIWSGYVVGALLLSYEMLILPLWFREPNPVIFVPCSFATLGLYVLYINFATGGRWFLSFALPVIGGIGLIVTTLVALLKYLRRGRLYIFGGALLALALFVPLIEFLLMITFDLPRFLAWSLYAAIPLTLFGLMLIVLAIHRPSREVMERKFFL